MSAHAPLQRRSLAVALGLLCMLGAPAHAQVLRCTDARTGAISYTDGACDTGLQAREVLPLRSAEDIARERALAAQALARKEQRLRDAAASAALRPAPAVEVPAGPAESPRCAQSRQQLQGLLAHTSNASASDAQRFAAAQRQLELDCLGAQAYSELEQSRSATAPAPIIIVPPRVARPRPPPPRAPMAHCNVFRCVDRDGHVHPR